MYMTYNIQVTESYLFYPVSTLRSNWESISSSYYGKQVVYEFSAAEVAPSE